MRIVKSLWYKHCRVIIEVNMAFKWVYTANTNGLCKAIDAEHQEI